MPFSPSEILEIQGIIDAYYATKKKRIPELNPSATFGDVSLLDRIPLWMNAPDKTVWADLITLKAIMTTGASGTIAPSVQGSILTHTVTAAEEGGDTVLIPELAGKQFFLRLEGRPVLPTEFEILNAGGFKMKPVDGSPYTLTKDQRFDLQVYELMAVPTGGPAQLSSSFVVGEVEISSSQTLNGVNHANKLIKVRGAAAHITITLPDIATTPANAVFPIEAQINNTYQTKIQTTGGQSIYMNNTSMPSLWLPKGEMVWVYRSGDGWIVINEFGNYYKSVGKPYAAYTYEDDNNEMVCDGSDILKDDYPLLWQIVQTFGSSLTTDPAVYAANKGMWLDKDANTLTLPDLRGMFLRGINGGDIAGRFQDEAVNISTGVKGVKVTGVNTIASSVDSTNPGGQEFDLTHVFDISPKQGTETRPANMGVMWVIKY